MTACRRQNNTGRRGWAAAPAAQSAGRSTRNAAAQTAGTEPAVRRYAHPIQTARPLRRSPTEELLSRILESLARQSELLEELLRRTESNSLDTK